MGGLTVFQSCHLSQPFKSLSSDAISGELRLLSRALEASALIGDRLRGAAAHARLVKLGDSAGRSVSLWNKLLKLYSRCGLPRLAVRLFDGMPERDIVSFNTMISPHLCSGCDAGEALRLYSQMLDEELRPNHITFSALFASAGDTGTPHLVEQTHAHTIKFGLNTDGFVGSAMVKGYERCRGLEESLRAFEEIAKPDAIAWNIMIDACARRGSKLHAIEIFSLLRQEGSGSFDFFTLTSVLKTCFEGDDLGLGMQLHGCAWKVGLVSETPVGNALVTMYLRCGGGMDSAVEAFQGISEPNIISWTAMIAGLMQNSLAEEAARFYKEMIRTGVMENEFCFASIMPVFSILTRLELGRMAHARIIKLEFWPDVMVQNALIDMYFKCGCLEDAQLAFETMRARDVVSWTTMILGFGQHGKGREAFELFRAMAEGGFKPDRVTFLATLSACSHVGLVDEGLRVFRSMVDEHGIKPKEEHYACIVDMLGRAGRLKDAERFIVEKGFATDPLAWEALLGACGIHGEMELAEKSAQKVMDLEPHKDGPYVLLSNIYAERRMWEAKEKLRKKLDASGLRKEIARSW